MAEIETVSGHLSCVYETDDIIKFTGLENVNENAQLGKRAVLHMLFVKCSWNSQKKICRPWCDE